MLLQSVSRASVRGGGSVGAESGQAEPNPARRGPPRPKTQPGAFPGSLRIRRRERLSGGADPTCAHRERHPRFRTLTQRSVLTDAQTDWAGKWARRGTCMALESTLVPFVWPRTAAGCDQGPPSVEPRWRRCSVQIQSGRILPRDVDRNPIYLPCAHQSARWHQFLAMLLTSENGAAGRQHREGRISRKISCSNHKLSPQ